MLSCNDYFSRYKTLLQQKFHKPILLAKRNKPLLVVEQIECAMITICQSSGDVIHASSFKSQSFSLLPNSHAFPQAARTKDSTYVACFLLLSFCFRFLKRKRTHSWTSEPFEHAFLVIRRSYDLSRKNPLRKRAVPKPLPRIASSSGGTHP